MIITWVGTSKRSAATCQFCQIWGNTHIISLPHLQLSFAASISHKWPNFLDSISSTIKSSTPGKTHSLNWSGEEHSQHFPLQLFSKPKNKPTWLRRIFLNFYRSFLFCYKHRITALTKTLSLYLNFLKELNIFSSNPTLSRNPPVIGSISPKCSTNW